MSNNNPIPLGKVTAFITRGPAEARELLVFRHPHAGVQLPAGTVEEGEPFEVAALREAWEETGLSELAVVAHLGGREDVLWPEHHMVLCKVSLRLRPEYDAPEVERPPWFLGLRRGLPVRHVSASDGWVEVAFEEFDGPAELAAKPSRVVTGWVPADTVTVRVVRHFFHLTLTAPTPDTWVQSAEEWEHRFELFWVAHGGAGNWDVDGMNSAQAAWLTEYAERLLR